MAQDGVAKTIIDERIEFAVILRLIDSPAFAQLLRTKNQNFVISKFVIFYDTQSFKCLPQTNAVRNDTAVMGVDFVDGTFYCVFLEIEELPPDFALDNLS